VSNDVLGTKDPGVDTEYAIDARAAVTVVARRSWPYTLGAIAKDQLDSGFYFECTTAGHTARNYPSEWARSAGMTTNDGSAVWTVRHPSDAGLPTISSITFETTGLTVSAISTDEGIASFLAVGGTAGERYEVTAHIGWSTGEETDLTVVIPVASL